MRYSLAILLAVGIGITTSTHVVVDQNGPGRACYMDGVVSSCAPPASVYLVVGSSAEASAREGGVGAADLAGSIARVPVARQGFRSGTRSDGFSWRLAAFYAAFFGFSGIVMPFFPAWLQAKGLDSRATGIVLAVPMFIRLISVPSLARLADRRSAP